MYSPFRKYASKELTLFEKNISLAECLQNILPVKVSNLIMQEIYILNTEILAMKSPHIKFINLLLLLLDTYFRVTVFLYFSLYLC